jgi:hypothetical protein
MHVLIAVSPPKGFHFPHPEMIRQSADLIHGLLEGVLDFEAQTIETDNLGRVQAQIGTHEQAFASSRMDHGDEADDSPSRPPQ